MIVMLRACSGYRLLACQKKLAGQVFCVHRIAMRQRITCFCVHIKYPCIASLNLVEQYRIDVDEANLPE